MADPLRNDIISDVMCPWCIIGYRQLSQAPDATGTAHDIHWHPFELNPNGVPAMVFDRKHLVTGAQGVENYTSILSPLAEMRG